MTGYEESIVRAARSCDDCLEWLSRCEAACCRGFRFRIAPDSDVRRGPDEVRVRVAMTGDLRTYFELHGARVEADAVIVPSACCSMDGDRLHVTMVCSALTEDMLCALHTSGKPEGCVEMTLESVREGRFWAPPICLFAYKLKAERGEDEAWRK